MRFDDDPTDRDKQLVRKHLMHSLKSAMTDEKNITKGIEAHPNQKPITESNLASPKPIPSLFLNFL